MAKEKTEAQKAVSYIRESLADIKANLAVISEALTDSKRAEAALTKMRSASDRVLNAVQGHPEEM